MLRHIPQFSCTLIYLQLIYIYLYIFNIMQYTRKKTSGTFCDPPLGWTSSWLTPQKKRRLGSATKEVQSSSQLFAVVSMTKNDFDRFCMLSLLVFPAIHRLEPPWKGGFLNDLFWRRCPAEACLEGGWIGWNRDNWDLFWGLVWCSLYRKIFFWDEWQHFTKSIQISDLCLVDEDHGQFVLMACKLPFSQASTSFEMLR